MEGEVDYSTLGEGVEAEWIRVQWDRHCGRRRFAIKKRNKGNQLFSKHSTTG